MCLFEGESIKATKGRIDLITLSCLTTNAKKNWVKGERFHLVHEFNIKFKITF